jgi:hypothetical protein
LKHARKQRQSCLAQWVADLHSPIRKSQKKPARANARTGFLLLREPE